MMTNISGDDVVQIIRACRKANVTRLKMGELEVLFDITDDEVTFDKSLVVNNNVPPVDSNLVASDKNEEKVQEEIDREIDDFNLILENPVEWERRALNETAEV
jgi:hypothetical protein